MALTKEEKYARHREYMKTPAAREKQRIAAARRYADPVQYARIWALRNTPEQKEKFRIASAKYRATEKYKQRAREYKSSDKYQKWRRNDMFKKKFGITLVDYEKMFADQRGLCAICGKEETFTMKGRTHSLAVDHDHVTGKIRGLLCRACNQLLGLGLDNIEILKGAISYLQHVH